MKRREEKYNNNDNKKVYTSFSKEHIFIHVIRVCLAEQLFDFLHIDNQNTNGLLYCSKGLSDIILNQCLKKSLISCFKLNFLTREKQSNVRRIKNITHEKMNFAHFKNLIELQFCISFNQQLIPKTLPQGLIKIKFLKYSDYNQPMLKGIFPDSLKYLSFGWCFNQPLTNSFYQSDTAESTDHNLLPKSLIKLKFGHTFNHQLIDASGHSVFPSTLEKLIFGNDFNQPLDKHSLPKSLICIKFGNEFNQQLDENTLPRLLKIIKFGIKFNKPFIQSAKTILPQGLLKLVFGKNFNKSIYEFPQSLTILKFGDLFDHPIQGLPDSLIKLKFGNAFDHSLDKFPESLSVLKYGNNYNQPLIPSLMLDVSNGFFFSNLTKLKFGFSFNHPLPILPESLIELDLGFKFKQNFIQGTFGKNFRKLTLRCGKFNSVQLLENLKLSSKVLIIYKY